ncbi:MAG: threonylcarbamoyl-AMP synthase [Candidatus Diapherotrites archaeon]|nr:threonylcarbamoyl-AMP synthase [Candidatus Diapherotrites archaeon]
MQVLSIPEDAPEDIAKAAAKALHAGEVIAYPTDTVYGLGVDATNEESVERLRRIKGKDAPISVMVSDFQMLKRYAIIDKKAEELAHALLPGKVTIVLSAKGLAKNLSQDGTIGFRMPAHSIAIMIVEAFGKPVTSTSANKTGKPTANTIDGVIEELGEKVKVYISGGDAFSEPSTVLSLVGKPRILRRGSDVERVEAAL